MWWIHLPEGYALDAAVRGAQLALALGRLTQVEIYAGPPPEVDQELRAAAAPWRALLAPQERALLLGQSPTLDHKERGLLDLMSSVSRLLRATDDAPIDVPATTVSLYCRPGHAVAPRNIPHAWLLLTLFDETQALPHWTAYDRVFAFAPWARGPLPQGVIQLPVAVDTGVFAPRPLSDTAEPKRLLLIGQGDKVAGVRMAERLLAAGSPKVTLFDPYLPHQTDLPDRMRHIPMRDPEGRAQTFHACTAAMVVDADPFVDNHFLWEAAACGATPLAGYLDRDIRTWDDAALRAALTAHTNGAVAQLPPAALTWRDVAERVLRTPPVELPPAVALLEDTSLPTMMLGHGGGRSRLAKPRLLGISIASHLIMDGLEGAAPNQLNLRWLDYQEPNGIRGRYYMYPQGEVEGRSDADVDYATLPAHLVAGDIDVMCSCDPAVDDFLGARQLWGTKAIPVVSMLHSAHGDGLSFHWLLQLLQYEIFPFDAVISPTRCGATALQHVHAAAVAWMRTHTRLPPPPPMRIEVIPYGIDRAPLTGLHKPACRQALDLPPDRVLLLTLSRFSRREKADMLPLLLAVRTLHQRGLAVTLLMAGGAATPDYFNKLQETVAALGLRDVVRFFDNVDVEQKKMLLGATDVFVSISDNVQETYGLAIVEAMAARLPVVASAWDGAREIVREDETGFLVPTVWQPPAREVELAARLASGVMGYGNRDLHESVVVDIPILTQKLATLVEHPHLRECMGQKGWERCVQEYDLPTQGRRMVELMRTLVQEARRYPWQPNRDRGPFMSETAQRFAHYPEAPVSDALSLEVSPLGADRNACFQILRAGWDEGAPRERVLARRIIAWAAAHPGASVGALCGAISDATLTHAQARLRVVRCWKYGLLQRASGTCS